MNKVIVVCRFNEDVQWLDELSDDWRQIIIQKDVDLPNIGRDPSSELFAIVRHYDEIEDDDIWCFMQGNTSPHFHNLADYLNNLDTDQVPHYLPLNDEGFLMFSDNDYRPYAKKWWGLDLPHEWKFYGSCTFLVSGQNIKSYPKESYQLAYDDIMDQGNDLSHPVLMYAQERFYTYMYSIMNDQ